MGNNKYLTKRAADEIPVWLQRLIWYALAEEYEKDYLQVFEVKTDNGMIEFVHSQEEPPFRRVYTFREGIREVNMRIYVIDDGIQTVMMLAEEY